MKGAYPMDTIKIKGLRLFAYHGVNPEEKRDGQSFVLDIDLRADLSRARRSDALEDTVNYGAVTKTVRRAFTQASCDLIERAAQAVCDAVLEDFPQVEEITVGAISGRAMLLSLSVGVAVSIGIAMLRVVTGVSIWYFLVGGYAVALGLSFFVPKIFTAVAFDSGGVASGPMTAAFMLPFAMGACDALGGDILLDAFGLVAMVAMTPLITIQLLGVLYSVKLRRAAQAEAPAAEPAEIEIFEFPVEVA